MRESEDKEVSANAHLQLLDGRRRPTVSQRDAGESVSTTEDENQAKKRRRLRRKRRNLKGTPPAQHGCIHTTLHQPSRTKNDVTREGTPAKSHHRHIPNDMETNSAQNIRRLAKRESTSAVTAESEKSPTGRHKSLFTQRSNFQQPLNQLL